MVLLLDRQGGWAFCIALATVSVVAGLELISLLRAAAYRPIVAIVLAGCVATAVFPAITSQPETGWIITLLACTAAGGAVVLHPSRFRSGTRDWLATTLIPVYVGTFFACLGLLRDAVDGAWWVFFALATTWAYDTGAYIAGRIFGMHPFMSHISPKKTVEGVVGGLFASTIVCGIAAPVIGITLWQAILLGLLAGAAAQIGDLLESMIKRNSDVKDSGTMIPGHGGILDRIDGLLFAAPVFLVAAFVLGYAP